MGFLLASTEAGVVKQKRRLKDITPYLYLVPKPTGSNITVKHNADVYDTVGFIPYVVKATLKQTRQLARELMGETLKETCANIWRWIYDHIEFEKDESFLEQVRTPSRLIYEHKGDCDCYTTTINSLLENIRLLSKWTFRLANRITKYGGTNFQHIYPYVITSSGERIFIDCVTENFNYEEPYTEKKDYIMDLQLLNGIDGIALDEMENEFNGLPDEFAQADDLGKLKDVFKKVGTAVKKVGKVATKVVHVANRVNPLAAVLRTGILVAMKANALNIAGRIKWGYLRPEQAMKRKLKMKEYNEVRTLRERLDKIFFGAGGKAENLRTAIMTGKGNKSNDVAGLGVIPFYAMRDEGLTAREILGEDLYQSESHLLEGLGAPFVMPAVVTTALAAIAAALKKIGSLKPGGSDSDDPDAASDNVSSGEVPAGDSGSTDNGTTDNGGATDDGSNAKGSGVEIKFSDDPMGWMKANPMQTGAAALVICAVGYGVYKVATKKKEEPEYIPVKQPARQLAGIKHEKFYPIMLAD